MRTPSTRTVWLGIGLVAAGLATASLVLTPWLDLHPCHLCIFQRLLFMLLAAAALTAAAGHCERAAGGLVGLLAAAGIVTAGYQSWLQLQEAGSVSCVGGDPDLVERVVEALGQVSPTLFLATGFCADEELVILGLSLANWAFLAFLACLAAAAWALAAPRTSSTTGAHP